MRYEKINEREMIIIRNNFYGMWNDNSIAVYY